MLKRRCSHVAKNFRKKSEEDKRKADIFLEKIEKQKRLKDEARERTSAAAAAAIRERTPATAVK